LDDDKAFDAVESYLCETETEPSEGWRTVSLVTALLGILSHGPEFERPTPEARSEAFIGCADELSKRGLDAVALVRYGMMTEALAPVLASLIVEAMSGDFEPIHGIDAQRWRSALGIELPTSNSGESSNPGVVGWFEDALLPAVPTLRKWAAGVPLKELIDLRPPTRDFVLSLPTHQPGGRGLRDLYRWAVDHFAHTYYRDWDTTSLHYELRWLDGDILPPCPDEIMRDRKVSRGEIAQEIARRVVYKKKTRDPGESLVSEMTLHARRLLRQGRYSEAAAVFEFGVQQRPEDAEIRNNLGFCLIPLDAREALNHLSVAANMGYGPSATNAYNQMCCYVAMGRSRAALNVAEDEWKRSQPARRDAMLWKQSADAQWELSDSEDCLQSVAQFAADIAHAEGWEDQEKYWRGVLQRHVAEMSDSASVGHETWRDSP